MKRSVPQHPLPGSDLSDARGLFRRIVASAATIPASCRHAERKADDDAALAVAVLFSMLGLLLFLGLALFTDSEAMRQGLLHLG